MTSLAAAPAAVLAPTFGWDTVFAVSVDRINRAIAQRKTSPKTLTYVSGHPNGFQMTADFGDWSVIPKGDGPIVRMALPMTNLNGSYRFKGQTYFFTCADALGVIEIKLNLLPHDGKTVLTDSKGKPLPDPAPGTTRHTLTPRAKSTDPTDPVATFVAIDFRMALSLPAAKLGVESGFQDWCNANLADFAHVFAVMDLNDKIATGRWAFCKPHTMDYAIVDSTDMSKCYLGLLCMTSKDTVPGTAQLSDSAVPPGCESGFLVSPRRLLADLLTPSMAAVWPKLDTADLEIASNDRMLQLKPAKTVELPVFKDSNGDSYTPVLTMFTLEIMGDQMKVDTHVETEVSSGIYGTCTATYWYKLGLGKTNMGEPALTWSEAQPAQKQTGSRSDPGIAILKGILSALGAILALLALVLDPPLALIVGAVVCGIAIGQFEINNIQESAKGDAPGLDDLTANFTAPVVWTDTADYGLQSAGLSGSLQMGGVWNT